MELNVQTMKSLADDFTKAVTAYRKARKEAEDIKEEFLDSCDRRGSIYDSKDLVKLTRVEYWENILESKIQVIAAIGGSELMHKFCAYLEEYEEKYCEERLDLVSRFDVSANGICGWYS